MIDRKLFATCISSAGTLYVLYHAPGILQWMFTRIKFYHNIRQKRKFYVGYYSSVGLKRDKAAKEVLLLYHGTEDEMLPISRIDYVYDNVTTVDINPQKNPTYVEDAIKLESSSCLMRFSQQWFDIICIPLCNCHIMDQMREVGVVKYITRIAHLLKDGGFVYFAGFDVFKTPTTTDRITTDILNKLGLRVPYYSDIKDSSSVTGYRMWNIFTKAPNSVPMTDTTNFFEPCASVYSCINEKTPEFKDGIA